MFTCCVVLCGCVHKTVTLLTSLGFLFFKCKIFIVYKGGINWCCLLLKKGIQSKHVFNSCGLYRKFFLRRNDSQQIQLLFVFVHSDFSDISPSIHNKLTSFLPSVLRTLWLVVCNLILRLCCSSQPRNTHWSWRHSNISHHRHIAWIHKDDGNHSSKRQTAGAAATLFHSHVIQKTHRRRN